MRVYTVADYPYPDPLIEEEPDWRDFADCQDHDWRLWFPDLDGIDPTQALRICATCPVADPCLETALQQTDYYDQAGIYAGTNPLQRAALRQQQRRTGKNE
jgi:hypothetical protein